MANWIQRFLTAIATHKADASAHHVKTPPGWVPTGDGGTKVAADDIEAAAGIPLTKLEEAVCSETEADNKIAARVPSGLIVMWHGTIANIPAGWVICDGGSGTPNLLTKFVEGVATVGTDPGATGGATSKTTAGHHHPLSQVISGALRYDQETSRSTNTVTDSISDIRPLYYDIAFIMKT